MLVGCSTLSQPQSTAPVDASLSAAPPTSQATAAPPASAASPASTTPSSSRLDPWQQAMNRATSAATIAQSASSKDDWSLVISRWQQAIALLQNVPASHAQHNQVQGKIAEYRRNLAIAQERAKNPVVTLSPEVIAASADETSPIIPLGELLGRHGAIMYGTYWCPACSWQRRQLGEEFSQIEYVECDPAGENARPDRCNAANVRVYPTWQIDGQIYPGGMSLEQLASLVR